MNGVHESTPMGASHGSGTAEARRGLSRRRWLAEAALVGAGTLVACAQSGEQSPPAAVRLPAGTTLTYVSSHTQAQYDLLQGQFQAFAAKYPGVKVDFANSSGAIADKLITLLAAGTPFDMFFMGQVGWPQIANKGAMLEIDSRVKRDKYDVSNFIHAAVSQYLWRNKHIGLGATIGFTLLYFNPGALQETGVPPPTDDWSKPWTWAQFVDLLKRVTVPGAGGTPDRYGLTGLDIHRIQATHGVLAVNPDHTRTLYDTPEAIETWDWLFDLVHTHRVAQNPLDKGLSASQAFITGKTAIWYASTPDGVTTLVPQKGLFPWDVAPTAKGPSLKGDKWTYGGGNGWFLASPSRTPDAAWELLKYMLQPETGRKLAASGWPPSRVSVINSPEWQRPGEPPAHKRPTVDGAKLLVPNPKLVNWSDFADAVNDEVQALWRGERRGKEVATRIRQRTDPILAEHQRLYKEGK